MTCYKRQKSVKLTRLHKWQLWKKNAAKQEARCSLFTHPCYQATVTNAFAVLCLLCKPGSTFCHFEDFLSPGAQLSSPSKGSLFHLPWLDLQWPNPWGSAAPHFRDVPKFPSVYIPSVYTELASIPTAPHTPTYGAILPLLNSCLQRFYFQLHKLWQQPSRLQNWTLPCLTE